jgi:hypothetical protein
MTQDSPMEHSAVVVPEAEGEAPHARRAARRKSLTIDLPASLTAR